MFKKRNYEEIANGLQKRKKPVSVNEQFPEDYLWVCKSFSENKISADYVLLSYEKAKQ
ncbi:hypothetical protein [Paenibacillus durus]|uniref:hypothetical protein n=1 Tax=Paenibacillus durus TaxID=44251 RepID=UPI000A7F4258|nr:hypothetical protein [Paenibacillus durus]